MPILRFFVWIFSSGMMVAGAGVASGQDFPNKPLRIVTSNVGGGSDFAARIIAQGLTDSFGQQAIVDNRGGANGVIAAQTVANASPDGHTLLLWSSGLWTLPLMQKAPYDPMRDFSPVTLAASSPNIIVVHPSLPVKSVKDLIALAKARPGDLNYASGNTGSPNPSISCAFPTRAPERRSTS
ncbi:MAG: hypothetical protein HYY79_00175 [Betaproteobacteria bacterium]|nr:hypothetical protein [Betaproteobacteria bacterium]